MAKKAKAAARRNPYVVAMLTRNGSGTHKDRRLKRLKNRLRKEMASEC